MRVLSVAWQSAWVAAHAAGACCSRLLAATLLMVLEVLARQACVKAARWAASAGHCRLLLPACGGCLDAGAADKGGRPYSRTPCMQPHLTLAVGPSLQRQPARYTPDPIKLCAAHNKGEELDHCPCWGCAQSVKVNNPSTWWE